MIKKKEPEWRRLDNSAKIFPISAGKKYSTVFRLSAVLTENIEKAILEKAVEKALKTFIYFKVKMKEGFFWYYFEENDKKIKVEEEQEYPCKYIDPKTNNNYLFKVTYFKNKINIDIFHALTDGNSGQSFFKEILYSYLEIKYKDVFKEERRRPRKSEYDTEDSYLKNYDKKLKSNASQRKAYIIKGQRINLGAIAAIHEIIDLEELKNICKTKDVTITQYLTAVLIYSIYKEKYKHDNSKKPIKVCIPVDLKKYFQSKTISNFFTYITLEADIDKDNLKEFDNILAFVKNDFERRLDENEIRRTMSGNVKLGINILTKMVPLRIKKILVRLSYIQIRKYTTITFSNIRKNRYNGQIQRLYKILYDINCSRACRKNQMFILHI